MYVDPFLIRQSTLLLKAFRLTLKLQIEQYIICFKKASLIDRPKSQTTAILLGVQPLWQ